MNTDIRVNFISAPAGSGKSYRRVREAVYLAQSDQKVLVVATTKDLIDQTAKHVTAEDSGLLVRKIYSTPFGSSPVREEVRHHLRPIGSGGEIVLITHEALLAIEDFAQLEPWTIIGDEALPVVEYHPLNVPESHRAITDHLHLGEDDGPYARLLATDVEKLAEIARNKRGDAVWEKFQDLAADICSPNRQTYVLKKTYENLVSNKGRKLLAYSVLNIGLLRHFKSVHWASALFEDTLFYHVGKQQGVEFRCDETDGRTGPDWYERTSPYKPLRFQTHQNGHLLTVKYILPESWSKWQRKQSGVWNAVTTAVRNEFGEARFLWSANRDMRREFQELEGARELSGAPQGLNHYADYHNVALLSAQNPSPDLAAFYMHLGLTQEQVKTTTHRMAVYQAAVRCSLRNPDDTNEKTILVPDKDTAEWLSKQFPGSTVCQVDVDLSGIGSPKKVGRKPKDGNVAATGAERVRAHRERIKTNSQDMLMEQ